jgi:hypothetical protein
MFSDLNPWLAWLGPAAEAVKAKRQPVDKENAVLKVEKAASTALSASLEYYRALRDASSEAAFFQIYGNVFSLYLADKRAVNGGATAVVDSRELPFVQEALASIEEGGFPEALARVACLLARKGEPLLLSKLQTKREILADYKNLLPAMPPDQWRRVRGEQEIIVRYEPDRALATLPKLLAKPADRERLVTLARKLLGDERMRRATPTDAQVAMVEDLRVTLGTRAPAKSARKRAARRRAAV